MLTLYVFLFSHLVVISHKKAFYSYLLVHRLKNKVIMLINIIHKSKYEIKTLEFPPETKHYH